MKNLLFPRLTDYPPEMITPKDDAAHAKIVESCGVAYFYGNPVARFLFKRRLMKTLRLLGSRKFQRILDAGTGIGYFLPALAPIAERVDAVDYHQVSVEYARAMLEKKNITNVALEVGDILNLPYPDQSFDAIVCLSTFEHIQDLERALLELQRVLKPEGILAVGYPMEDWLMKFFIWLDRRTFFRKYEPELISSINKGDIVWHVSSWRDIDLELMKAFSVVKKEYISVLPLIGRVYALRLAKSTTSPQPSPISEREKG